MGYHGVMKKQPLFRRDFFVEIALFPPLFLRDFIENSEGFSDRVFRQKMRVVTENFFFDFHSFSIVNSALYFSEISDKKEGIIWITLTKAGASSAII